MNSEVRSPRDEHPLAAFRAALLGRHDVLVVRAVERLRRILPWLAQAPDEFLVEPVKEDVAAYAYALTAPDFSDLERRARAWCESQVTLGGSVHLVLQLVEGCRQDYLEFAIDAVVAGVPEARAGVHRLMEAFTAVLTEVDAFFHGSEAREAADATLFRHFVDASPDPVALAGGEGTMLIYANAAFKETFGGEGIPGRFMGTFVPDEQKNVLAALATTAFREGRVRGELHLFRANGELFKADVLSFIAQSHDDRQPARFWLLRDKGPLVEAEEARMRLQEEIIASQAEAIRALSTPLLPIAEGVILMPLVGALNEQRAEQMLDTMLQGISRRGARVAILDITGVSDVDSHVAHGILRAARAASLLGARVFLTGIRGPVAQTLLALDANFGGLVTCSTLQDGVARALRGAGSQGYAPRRWTG
ncbi:STAS domain-containing protein [Polyangium sp. y55x31]|uniref:STAS domain-containing protein n=1 Tax=Polyangium sp. y55x31 TaxID=3042688 RepID=UPI002482CAB2|nr:STAS domain-containing protein [Polyangium sp. y55x31]MDI1483383.1 PAS domain-containing protein [Polyangium sp. y55x31]